MMEVPKDQPESNSDEFQSGYVATQNKTLTFMPAGIPEEKYSQCEDNGMRVGRITKSTHPLLRT